jgi:hypothetical protein
MNNKCSYCVFTLFVLSSGLAHTCTPGNEFQKWTSCGEAYQEWTKQGNAYTEWTAGPNGYQSSDYSEAYIIGRIEAYRAEHGMSAVTPIQRIAPIEKVGKNEPIDGFTRGFYEYYQERKKVWMDGK